MCRTKQIYLFFILKHGLEHEKIETYIIARYPLSYQSLSKPAILVLQKFITFVLILILKM